MEVIYLEEIFTVSLEVPSSQAHALYISLSVLISGTKYTNIKRGSPNGDHLNIAADLGYQQNASQLFYVPGK
jgi:hypothetical protein